MISVLNRIKEISYAVMYAAEANDLETVLERIAEVARELAQTQYAALGVPDGQGGLRYFKHAGMDAEMVAKISHLPRGQGLIGAIMRGRKPIVLDDMNDDPRSSGFPEHHPPMNGFLGVPIIVGDHLYGMLYLSNKINGEKFNEEDLLLIETLAGYAALAIAGAEVSHQRTRLRMLEERERIGMELHDGIIQSLYGIGMQVELLRRVKEQIPRNDLGGVIDSLNDVIEDIRSYITKLRHDETSTDTICECMHQLKARLHPPESIEIAINAPNITPPFTTAAFESICLIINEALSNAIRHAEASAISVDVQVTRSHFVVIVEDNGIGFDLHEAENKQGLGLRNMQQRARLYGGEVVISSEPEVGTRLVIEVPTYSY